MQNLNHLFFKVFQSKKKQERFISIKRIAMSKKMEKKMLLIIIRILNLTISCHDERAMRRLVKRNQNKRQQVATRYKYFLIETSDAVSFILKSFQFFLF